MDTAAGQIPEAVLRHAGLVPEKAEPRHTRERRDVTGVEAREARDLGWDARGRF